MPKSALASNSKHEAGGRSQVSTGEDGGVEGGDLYLEMEACIFGGRRRGRYERIREIEKGCLVQLFVIEF
jgi:hypothetical protein